MFMKGILVGHGFFPRTWNKFESVRHLVAQEQVVSVEKGGKILSHKQISMDAPRLPHG